MNLFDLLFGGGRAIQVIFELGYIPDRKDFLELTPQQYMSYHEKTGDYGKEKLYALIPSDSKAIAQQTFNELLIFSENEVEDMMKGRQIIENYLHKADKTFDNDTERLAFVANQLPDVFSEGTKFGKAKVVEMTNPEKHRHI